MKIIVLLSTLFQSSGIHCTLTGNLLISKLWKKYISNENETAHKKRTWKSKILVFLSRLKLVRERTVKGRMPATREVLAGRREARES